MTRTLLTGATGRLGSALAPRLHEAGHDLVAASRSPPDTRGLPGVPDDALSWAKMDLADGTGVEAAVEDVDVVVHTASNATGDHEAVDAAGTQLLVSDTADAGVEHLLYPSIVGIDEIPYGYYQHKLAAEGAVLESDVPATIVRATQFHGFVDDLLGMARWLPAIPAARGFRIQPIDERNVADAVVEHLEARPVGRVPPIGGPTVHAAGDIAQAYRETRELRRPVLRIPIPGATASAFRAGKATCPERTVGKREWTEWLVERYGSGDR